MLEQMLGASLDKLVPNNKGSSQSKFMKLVPKWTDNPDL